MGNDCFIRLRNKNFFLFADINECRQRGVCAQVCDNSIGSFVCRCFQGYTLNGDKVTCSGEFGEFIYS